jgi:hypothetical protein
LYLPIKPYVSFLLKTKKTQASICETTNQEITDIVEELISVKDSTYSAKAMHRRLDQKYEEWFSPPKHCHCSFQF